MGRDVHHPIGCSQDPCREGERHKAEGVTEVGQVQVRESRPAWLRAGAERKGLQDLPAFWQMLFSRRRG